MVRRVILGRQPDGSYGMRASKAGYDVGSNPVDNTQLTFNSDWNTVLPVYLSGNYLGIANNATVTIPFTSIGYIPLGYFMFRPNGQTGWNSLPPSVYSGTNIVFLMDIYIDHIKVINKIGLTTDVCYSLFYALTQ